MEELANMTDQENKVMDMVNKIVKEKEKLQLKIFGQAYLENLRYKIEDEDYVPENYIMEQAKHYTQLNLAIQKKKQSFDHYWITINPRPSTTFEQLYKCVKKLSTHKCIYGMECVFEYANREQPHVHILVYQMGKTDSAFRKDSANPFKSLVDDVLNRKWVNIRGLKPHLVESKKQYVRGIKNTDEKMGHVFNDIIKREDRGIDHLYKFGIQIDIPDVKQKGQVKDSEGDVVFNLHEY